MMGRYAIGAPPRMHVWHQGRKVTGRTEAPGVRGHYQFVRGRGYVWVSSRQEKREQRMRRYRQNGQLTIADRASPATSVRCAMNLYFRLLDPHGRPYGRRFHLVGQVRQSDDRSRRAFDYLVEDQYGNQQWMREDLRVRIVAQQEEDQHSRFSRMLKAAFRSAAE